MADQLEDRRDFIAGLRQLADALEEHPQLEDPGDLTLYVYLNGDDAAQRLAEIASALPGRVEKKADSGFFGIESRFGPITYYAYGGRSNICERVVVGKETVVVEEEVELTPAETATRKREEEREIVEWRCEPLLAKKPDLEAVA